MRKLALLLAFLSLAAPAQERQFNRHFLGNKGPLTAASSRPAREIASDFLKIAAPGMGLAPAGLAGAYVAREYADAHNGVTHILYRQQFQGIDVYGAAWVVNIDAQGRVLNAGGNLYPAPTVSAPAPASAFSAVRAAVLAVNPKAAQRFVPFESRTPSRKNGGIRFAQGGDLTTDVEGQPVWYSVRGALRPGWLFDVVAEDGVTRFGTIVDSASQKVVVARPRTYFQSASQARGLVFEQGSPQPNLKPGTLVTAPPPIVDRTLQPFTGDAAASPRGWVTGGETAGNNVVAGQNLLGELFLTTPTTAKAADNNFSFPLQLGPDAPNPVTFPDAITTNLFYWMNRAHDLHYAAGFTEAAGNFQASNFGHGGVEGDPMYAYTHFGAASPTRAQRANAFFTEGGDLDGSPAMVAMFISDAGRGSFITDGSLDAYVMVHEYTHGVSSRLLPNGYDTFQVAAMGEAWSDFYALEYTLPDNAPPDGTYAVGEYFFQSWTQGSGRSRPYSANISINPLTFASLGQVIPFPEVHADGEIWMEALWDMRANLIRQLGEKEGRRRVRLLVLDGMKLAPPFSSMVDMRDAILLADRTDFKGESQSPIWAAFAKRGLGALAWSVSPDSVHIKASYDLPSDKGQVAFYDNTFTLGEPVRIIAQDLNYTQPTVRVQVTSGAGDVEDVILKQTGSLYVGTLPTSPSAAIAPQDGALQVMSADYVSVYYNDYNAPGGAAQIQATIQGRQQYALSSTAASFTFSNETPIDMSLGYLRVDLPFEFPFYEGKYRSVIVDENAGLFFRNAGYGANYAISGCYDSFALASATAITPLWVNMSSRGGAQAREGVYMSQPSPNAVTFRWAGETYTVFAGIVPGSPVNVAATLYDDGAILFQYGGGNAELGSALTFAGCQPGPTVGLSPGHDTVALSILLPSYANARSIRFDPPFGAGSVPAATIESPAAGDSVQDVLTVTGVVSDAWSAVTRIDIMVDGKAIGTAAASISRPDVCAAQKDARFCAGYQLTADLSAAGFKPGQHSLRLRTTNARAAFTDSDPVPFTMNAGKGDVPHGGIDSPIAGAEITGTLIVRGYALSDNLQILSADTLIDGISYGPTSYNQRRDDICAPLSPKPPNCPAVGFLLNLNTRTALPPVVDGSHSVQVRVRDEAARYTLIPETPVTFTLKNGPYPAPAGAITSLKPGDRLSGTVRIAGYAYSPGSTVRSALLVVDGDSYGTIPYGQPAPDACAALPDVEACPNIGFALDFDTTRLFNGPHVIQVYVTDARGNSTLLPAAGSPVVSVVVAN